MSAYMNRAGQDFWPRFRSRSFVEIARARQTYKKFFPAVNMVVFKIFQTDFPLTLKRAK